MFTSQASPLHFGPFTMDRAGHCLLRDGTRVVIQEQPYQILLALLESPGQVVTRESLRQRLWGEETFVDFDQSLNSAVRRLRVALGDSPRQPVYVATVPRVGFRFLAEVREEVHSPEIPEETHGVGAPELLGEVPVAMLPSPLPVAPDGRGRWPAWAFGVLFGVVALGGALAGAPSSRVWTWRQGGQGTGGTEASAPATAQGFLADGAASLPELREGSASNRGSASGDPESRTHSRTSDSGLLLPVTLARGRADGSDALGPTRLTELTGWYHLGLRTEMDYGLAKQAFARVIAEDPGEPTPLVGLAEAEILMALNGFTPATRLRAARRAGERAVRMSPDLPDAHAVLGAVEALEQWNLPAAEREFRVALALDPHAGLARLWLAVFVLLPERRYAEAEQETRAVLAETPMSLTAHTNLGWIYFNQGRHAAAMEQYRFVLNINPDFVPARFHLSQLLRAEGRMDEAARMQPIDPPGPDDAVRSSGGIRGGAGVPVSAATDLQPARCEQITGEYNGGGGDAMSVIRAAVEARCSNFFFFGQDPVFRHLHGTPEFAALQQTAFVRER